MIPNYEPMAPIIPEGEAGNARVKHETITQRDAEFSALRAVVTGSAYEAVSAGTIAQLLVNGYLVMSDTHMEQRTNREFLRAASVAGGDILIGGLGLGMILVPLMQMENVKTVTVIEKSAGVIKLVEPALSKHLVDSGFKADGFEVHNVDIFGWKPPRGKKWDVIYFDIWANICTDNLDDITKLKRRYARRLNRDNPAAWMGAWEEARLRMLKRRDRWR